MLSKISVATTTIVYTKCISGIYSLAQYFTIQSDLPYYIAVMHLCMSYMSRLIYQVLAFPAIYTIAVSWADQVLYLLSTTYMSLISNMQTIFFPRGEGIERANYPVSREMCP